MRTITQKELDRRLNVNGWAWGLMSTMTPGIVRIQLLDDGEEEMGWRKCIEAPSLTEAVDAAEKFVHSINAYDYGDQRMSEE